MVIKFKFHFNYSEKSLYLCMEWILTSQKNVSERESSNLEHKS